jgi:lysophospholipase L1-like esterase
VSPCVVVYGDSISTGTHGGGGWIPALAELGPLLVHNHAVGSSPLAEGMPGSLVDVLRLPECLHPDADVVVLWHGTNDWYWGTPLGDPTSGAATYVGALTECVARLRSVRRDVPIVAPTPLWRFERPHGGTTAGDASTTRNAIGATLTDYRAALLMAAPSLALHVVDMDAAGVTATTASALLEDGVHPNAAGYRAISPLLATALKEVLNHER